MAVTGPAPRHFARLKLRLLVNNLRGSSGRVALFVSGAILASFFAGLGLLLAAASAAGGADARLLTSAFGGSVVVLGAVLLPLIWFGVDDSLDPARFALLPLTRRQLVTGLFTAALLSIPALGLLLASAGLLVPAAVHGGIAAVGLQVLGVLGGLLVCVAAGRAVTGAFATMLRSRRMRDLAGILLATFAALIAPLQLMLMSALQQADLDRLASVATVLGWTPLAAPYTVGYEAAEGTLAAAGGKLLITAVTVALLLWWWSRSLESAMVGAAASGGGRSRAVARDGVVAALLPRWLPGLPAGPTGALVARELRYWWRDAKRRANLISVVAVGVLLPLVMTYSGGFMGPPAEGNALTLTDSTPMLFVLLFVGSFGAMVLANQFGFDGTAYAAHLTVGVDGRRELTARMVALAVLVVPVFAVAAALLVALGASPAAAVGGFGLALAGFGTGAAVNSAVSVLAAYPLPEGSNPFATSTGVGLAKSMLAIVALLAGYVAAVPLLVVAVLASTVWPWVALPAGAAYAVGAMLLGRVIVGDLLERRMPELLAAVTPKQ